MGKHKKWTLEQKIKIVKEFKNGATISYLNNKYGRYNKQMESRI